MTFDTMPPFDAAALLLDLDGTLLDIASRPDGVVVPPDLPNTLRRLRDRLDGALAIITGRPVEFVDTLLGDAIYAVAGEHGGAVRHVPGEPVERPSLPLLPATWLETVQRFADARPGVLVEQKAPGFAVHFRAAPDAGPAVRTVLTTLLADDGRFKLTPGHMLWQVSPRGADKGKAVQALMDRPPFAGRRPVFIGDDVTDEDAIRAVGAMGGVGFRVDEAFGSPNGVRSWLRRSARRGDWAPFLPRQRRITKKAQEIAQRPAAYRFGLVNGKIDVLPEQLETSIGHEVATDLYTGLTAKAGGLAHRIVATNSPLGVVDIANNILAELQRGFEEIRPGRLLSLSRSVDSYRIAFDTPEGRSEIPPDVFAMLNDVAESMRDLLSTFPITHKIEAERIALGLIATPNNISILEHEVRVITKEVSESPGVTKAAVMALSINDAEIKAADDIDLKSRLWGDRLLVLRNFVSAVFRGITTELRTIGEDSWQATRSNFPKGVGDTARIAAPVALFLVAVKISTSVIEIGTLVAGFTALTNLVNKTRKGDHPSMSPEASRDPKRGPVARGRPE